MRKQFLILATTVTLLGSLSHRGWGGNGDHRIAGEVPHHHIVRVRTFIPPGGEKLSSQVQHAVTFQEPANFIPVIVTLREQADLTAINLPDRDSQNRGVVEALQSVAYNTQGPIRATINLRSAQGLVDRVTYFWGINGFALSATKEVIQELATRPDVARITADESFQAPSPFEGNGPPEPNLTVINAPILWSLGYTGQGVVVANMDTGVDYTHPDLFSRWRGGTNSWFDPYGEHPTIPTDVNGHGTWTMGVMVGGDAGGTSIGVAPQAQWIAVKIFNDNGVATISAIHLGFQWLLDPDNNPDTSDAPHVVNNSWTFQNPGCNLEFQLDLQALRAIGILPIFAAGNSGPAPATSLSPANNPEAFAVGATDNNDQIYTYSSRGPSSCGEPSTIYPELMSPGVNIHTSDLYGFYTNATGTSLAAPHTSGGLALLINAFPNLQVSPQEEAIKISALDLGGPGPDNDYGYGRLDLYAAYQWLVNNLPPTPTPAPTPTSTPTPYPIGIPTLHVGDLDSISIPINSHRWRAKVIITVHSSQHLQVAKAFVSGSWGINDENIVTCRTNQHGQCMLTSRAFSSQTKSISFTMSNLVHGSYIYQSTNNHDPDGDSNGTTIIINQP